MNKKTFLPFLLVPVAFIAVAATTYTITQLTLNTSPSDGTIIEVYDPSASPKSGKYLFTNLVTHGSSPTFTTITATTVEADNWQTASLDVTGAMTNSFATASRAAVYDSASRLTNSTVTATELGHLSGVTSALQTQLNAKAPLASPTFTGSITYQGATTPDQDFSIASRTTPSLPAAYFRPVKANSAMALDVMPNGSPSESSGNGYAWIDVVNTDQATVNTAMSVLRLGIRSDWAEVGSKRFNSGTLLPLTFSMDGSLAMQIDTSSRVGIGAAPTTRFSSAVSTAGSEVGLMQNVNSANNAFAAWTARNDTGNGHLRMIALGTAWTTSGAFVQDGGVLEAGSDLSGGLSIAASHASGGIRFYTGGNAAGNQVMSLSAAGSLGLTKTITGAGTTGNQTINKASGSVNFAAAAQSITVTCSLVDANSVIMATVATDDATAFACKAIPGSGSFVLKLNAAATAETRVNWLVTN